MCVSGFQPLAYPLYPLHYSTPQYKSDKRINQLLKVQNLEFNLTFLRQFFFFFVLKIRRK
jgi:hypothetical protein